MPRSPLAVPAALASLALAGAALLGGCASGDPDTTVLGDLLQDLAPPTPGQAARDAFNVYDPDRRRQSVALLAASPFGGEPPYLRTYRLLIDDPDATVRGAAVKALGAHGEVADADLIIPRLRDDSPFVRWEAAKALQRIHNPAAAQPLMDLLRTDADADARMAAADALGQYAQPAVFDTLVGALTDRNYGVVSAAVNALRTLTGHPGDADPATWITWSRDRRADLFAGQTAYAYQAYQKPPGLIRKVMPFTNDEQPAPRLSPVGLETRSDDATSG